MLAALGIDVMQGYKSEHLEPAPDCVIVGNAIPRGNPELEAALNRKLVYRSQAEVVKEEFIRGAVRWWLPARMARLPRLVSRWVMDQGDLEPSFLIGASRRILASASCQRQQLFHYRRRRIRHRVF